MEEAVALLQEMLELYSPSTEERAVVERLVERMAGLGFRARVDGAGNAVGELGDGPRHIVLLGHIDTVPGHIPVHVEDGVIYGRGAVDAKGPLAVFVVAVARVGPLAGKRLTVVGAVEEEAATSKGARHVLDRYTPEVVIIGEPSGWDRITVGYKGRLLVDYYLTRPTGHSAGPARGICEEAVAFWERARAYAEAFNRDLEKMFDRLEPSLRRINSSGDGFTDTVEATIGWRLPPGFDTEGLKAAMREWAGEGQIAFYSEEPPFRAEKNTPLTRAFVAAIRAAGGRPGFKVKTGTSDMNVVGPVWGCPIVAYGPGDSALDHTPGEHLSLGEYKRAIGVLARVLRAL